MKVVWNIVLASLDESATGTMTHASGSSSASTLSRILPKRGKAGAIIICALGNAPQRGVTDVDEPGSNASTSWCVICF